MPIPKWVKNKSKWEKAWDRAVEIVKEDHSESEAKFWPFVMTITENIYKNSNRESTLADELRRLASRL